MLTYIDANTAIYITIILCVSIFFTLVIANLVLTILYVKKIYRTLETIVEMKDVNKYAELSKKYKQANKELIQLKQKIKKSNSINN